MRFVCLAASVALRLMQCLAHRSDQVSPVSDFAQPQPPLPETLNNRPPVLKEHGSRLMRRAFDPDEQAPDWMWNKYIAKGNDFLCKLKATDRGAGFLMQDTRSPPSAQSPWRGQLRSELQQWNWVDLPIANPESLCDFEDLNLKSAFEALHMNYKSKRRGNEVDPEGDIEAFDVEHGFRKSDTPLMKQKYRVGSKEYMCTGGYYKFAVNVQDGGMFALDVMSPAWHAKHYEGWDRPAQPGELPEIRAFSDIAMAYYLRDNPDPKKLRVFLAQTVVNDDTLAVVSRAIVESGSEEIFPWPGHSFSTTTDAGKALLGSPLGATIAHLLITHKAELGIKTIAKVTAFTDDDDPDPDAGPAWAAVVNLIFHIEDVPANEVPQDPPENKPGGKPGTGSTVVCAEDMGISGQGEDTGAQVREDQGNLYLRIHRILV